MNDCIENQYIDSEVNRRASAGTRTAAELFRQALAEQRQGKFDDAIRNYETIIGDNPESAGALHNLGAALNAQGKVEAAVAAYRRSVSLRPGDPATWSNLGNSLRRLGRYAEAQAIHRRALSLDASNPSALFNAGLVYRDLNQPEQAIRLFELAIDMYPDYVEAHWDRSLALLQMGDYTKGFREYEWRWKLHRHPPRRFEQPKWNGSDIRDKTILLTAEQGFGDMLQFARFVPLVAERAGSVIVECQPELVTLFQSLAGAAKVIAKFDTPPRFDLHYPLMSLPRGLGVTLEELPASTPYLAAPGTDSARADNGDGELKVGLVWAGKPKSNTRPRTALQTPDDSFTHFIELLGFPGVKFFSLQVGTGMAEPRNKGCGAHIRCLGEELNDFADTARVMAQLDLVITVDSAPAHLAGALGRPVWVMLPFTADWRWLLERTDSPWYPSMRLFRQRRPGDWKNAFGSMYRAFYQFVKEHKIRTRSRASG
jgi:tetratricopeptide (TPR) repeat protein